MAYSPGQAIWDLASGGVDNSTRNSFERRILQVWDAAVEAGRDDVADMAQREREWLYSSAYTPDAARDRVETLEWAAAAMLGATTTTTTSKPPTRKTPTTTTTTSKPPTDTTPSAPTPSVKAASSSPLIWGGLVLVAAVGVYYATRGR